MTMIERPLPRPDAASAGSGRSAARHRLGERMRARRAARRRHRALLRAVRAFTG